MAFALLAIIVDKGKLLAIGVLLIAICFFLYFGSKMMLV